MLTVTETCVVLGRYRSYHDPALEELGPTWNVNAVPENAVLSWTPTNSPVPQAKLSDTGLAATPEEMVTE